MNRNLKQKLYNIRLSFFKIHLSDILICKYLKYKDQAPVSACHYYHFLYFHQFTCCTLIRQVSICGLAEYEDL